MPEDQKNPDIDPALPKQALETLRSLIKGNGIKTQALTLNEYKGEILVLDAQTTAQIKSQTSNSTIAGKVTGGIVCRTAAELNGAVDKAVKNIASSDTSSEQVKKIILERADRGFGSDNEHIKLPSFEKEFFFHEICPTCQGQKQTACLNCQGQKQITCTKCRGRRHIPCKHCRGTGFTQKPGGVREKCKFCKGKRQTTCTLCHGRGMITCPTCQGRGVSQCSTCGGTGGQTQKTHLEVYADLSFQYDRSHIPPELGPILEQQAAHLVENKNIRLQLAQPTPQEEAKIPKDVIAIHYKAYIPYAHINLSLRKMPINAVLYGFQGKLLNIPPFLEKLTAKGIKNLQQAAANHGDVGLKIKQAARYRLLRDILTQTALQKPKNATKTILSHYPYGITEQAVKALSLSADRAFKNITRKPRYFGLGIGFILTTLFYAAYYLGPLRGMIAPYLPSHLYQSIADIAIILIGGAITTSSIQITASRALQNAVGLFLLPKHKKKLKPRAGKSAIWGYIGGICVYFIMIELTAHTDNATPFWYLLLKTWAGL